MKLKPPRHLKESGSKLWRELTEEYDIQDAGGLALVTAAAECLDRLRQAQEAIEAHGAVVTDRYGQTKINPACNLEKDARNGFLAALKQLNLDVVPPRDGPGRPPGSISRKDEGDTWQ